MLCNNCNQGFDLISRIPKLLPSCGHSLCSSCVFEQKNKKQLIVCPVDKFTYPNSQSLNDNLFLLEEIKKQMKRSSLCFIHNQRRELFCQTCVLDVCSNCVLFGEHKLHSYQQISLQERELRDRLGDRLEKLESINSYLEDNRKAMGEELERLSFDLREESRSYFLQVEELVERKKQKNEREIEEGMKRLRGEIEDLKSQVKERVLQIGNALQSGMRDMKEDQEGLKKLGEKEIFLIETRWNVYQSRNL